MTPPTSDRLTARVALSAVPFVGICGLVPLVNRVTPYLFGLPFFVFWIAMWTVLTSACMAVVYLLDPHRRERPR